MNSRHSPLCMNSSVQPVIASAAKQSRKVKNGINSFFYTRLFVLLFSFVALQTHAGPAHTLSFKEGKDYQVIKGRADFQKTTSHEIVVREFFSYGCPWCYELEPHLKKWLKHKPNNVLFQRVPVIFEKNWDYYAKAYYIAQALGIEKKMTPKLFYAIQQKNQTLASNEALQAFFIKAGVKKEVVQSAFEASPTLDIEMKQGLQLMQEYQVYVVPTFVINGQYKTDLRMAGNEKKLLQIVQFLINHPI